MTDKVMPTQGEWIADDGEGYSILRVRPPERRRLIAEVVGDDAEAEENAALIAAAGTAAHEVKQMGFDPVEAVKALPELLNALEGAFEIQPYAAEATLGGPTSDSAWDEVEGYENAIRTVLDRAAGKEGSDQ